MWKTVLVRMAIAILPAVIFHERMIRWGLNAMGPGFGAPDAPPPTPP